MIIVHKNFFVIQLYIFLIKSFALLPKNSLFDKANPFTISTFHFRDVTERVSGEIESKMIRKFAEDINYANLLADTGTTNRLTVQQFVISNPNFPSMRFPQSNFENINFNGIQYAVIFQEAIEKALQDGIKIVAIIADSQTAQTSGIIELLRTHENPNIKAIVHIPCVSHIINRVFASLLSNSLFKNLATYIDTLIEICRSPEGLNVIGKACPSTVETRWFYIVEVLTFLVENAPELANLCAIKEIPFSGDIISDLYYILHPLYKFSLVIEERSTSLSMLLPLIDLTIKNLIKNTIKIKTEVGVQIFTQVSTDFLARMLSLPIPLIQAEFALSPEGRNFIRTNENFQQ